MIIFLGFFREYILEEFSAELVLERPKPACFFVLNTSLSMSYPCETYVKFQVLFNFHFPINVLRFVSRMLPWIKGRVNPQSAAWHTQLPFIGTERWENSTHCLLIFCFIFPADLFLILTLTHLEDWLTSITTSKLAADGPHTSWFQWKNFKKFAPLRFPFYFFPAGSSDMTGRAVTLSEPEEERSVWTNGKNDQALTIWWLRERRGKESWRRGQ